MSCNSTDSAASSSFGGYSMGTPAPALSASPAQTPATAATVAASEYHRASRPSAPILRPHADALHVYTEKLWEATRIDIERRASLGGTPEGRDHRRTSINAA